MSQWLLLLKNFNNNKPLPPEMSARFEQYFTYYWKNDKNYALIDAKDRGIYSELPPKSQACIYKDFLFKDFIQQFMVYFCFEKPAYMQDKEDIIKYYEWEDLSYAEFMIKFLQALEPRFYHQQEYIFEEGEDVAEQIYVINRDPTKPDKSTGQYCIGFKYDNNSKYFHVKLGPKTVICAYDNMFGKPAEYTYKALMHIDAYGLRTQKLKPILDSEPEFKKQMTSYALKFYHEIVRMPMITFKKNILSQVTKRQTQDRIMKQIDEEIAEKEKEFMDELTKIEEDEGDDDDDDDCTNKQMKQ